jgi:MarR family transcriptional regulator, organic hydroperoxide resistance regulator
MNRNERNDKIGTLAITMLNIVPLLSRRVIKRHEMVEGTNLTIPMIGILFTLTKDGSLPLHVIAERHSYSRQNLTTMTDRLEAEGLVRRCPNIKDRRVIDLEITDAGRRYFLERGEQMKQILVKELGCMEDSEIDALRNSFETIERLYLKVEEAQK